MKPSEHPKKQIDYSRYEKAGSHEAADVAVVCNKTVQELSDSIYKKKCGAYQTQLTCRKHAFIDQRLLHDIDAHAADIIKAISDGGPPERSVPERLICILHLIFRYFVS